MLYNQYKVYIATFLKVSACDDIIRYLALSYVMIHNNTQQNLKIKLNFLIIHV